MIRHAGSIMTRRRHRSSAPCVIDSAGGRRYKERMKIWSLRSALMLAATLCAALPADADTLVVTPVALDQQLAPGGGRYILIGDMWIDSLRRVVFTASTSSGKMGLY